MKRFRRVVEKILESMLTLSGAVTTVTILLIVVFLFREGRIAWKQIGAVGIDEIRKVING